MRKYVIMGVQGSGKGTQAKLLAADFDLVHISVGDIFRWNVENHTKIGAQVRRIMAVGELVDDELVESIVRVSGCAATTGTTASSSTAFRATCARRSSSSRATTSTGSSCSSSRTPRWSAGCWRDVCARRAVSTTTCSDVVPTNPTSATPAVATS